MRPLAHPPRARLQHAVGCVLFATGLACSAFEAEDSTADDGDEVKSDSITNGAVVASTIADAELLKGYNEVTDESTTRCIGDPSAHPRTIVQVGVPEEHFEVELIANHHGLTNTLSQEFHRASSFLFFFKDEETSTLTHTFASQRNSVSFLMRLRRDYRVTIDPTDFIPELGSEFAAWVDGGDLPSFYEKCGTRFISGLRFGGYVHILVTLSSNSWSESREVQGSLENASGHSAVAELRTEWLDKVTELVRTRDLEVHVKVDQLGVAGVSTQGLENDLRVLLTQEAGASEQVVWDRVAQIRGQVEQSVSDDLENDRSIGYYDNHGRNAAVTGVILASYDVANNIAPGSQVLATLADAALQARQSLEGLARLESSLGTAIRDELGVFLGESRDDGKSQFNVMPPGLPLATVPELHTAARAWNDMLTYDLGTVELANDSCFNDARYDVSASCLIEGATALAYDDAWLDLDAYSSVRILPLRMALLDTPTPYDEAAQFCRFEAGDEEMRLPVASEVPLLAPTIGYGPLRSERAIWLRDNQCHLGSAVARFAPPADGEPIIECLDAAQKVPFVCVPLAGPAPR